MMEEWEHFERLQDEGYIGKSNFFYAVCRHCQRAYDEASEDKKPLLEPERMVGRREKMRKHLSICPHFKGDLPPLERRLPLRASLTAFAGGLPGVPGGAAETGDGISVVHQARSTALGIGFGGDGALASATSRLALDEWHYFTRLHRKKDSAYYYARCNFCQAAFEAAPETMKASMEPTIVMGRKSNMQTHLSKCIHVPKELFAVGKTAVAGFSADLGGSAADGLPPMAKRLKLDVSPPSLATQSLALSDMNSLHTAFMELLIQNRLPFDFIESSSTKKLIRLLVPLPDIVDTLLPSAVELRTKVLEGLFNDVIRCELNTLKESVPSAPFAAAAAGAASDELPSAAEGPDTTSTWPISLVCALSVKRNEHDISDHNVPRVECVLTNGKSHVRFPTTVGVDPSELLSAQEGDGLSGSIIKTPTGLQYFHGLDLARVLDEHIRLSVEREHLPLAVAVVPCTPKADRAMSILRSRWSHISFVPAFDDLLGFAVMKMLSTPEVNAMITSLVDLRQVSPVATSLSEVLNESDPFQGWRECTTLMQVVLDGDVFADNEEVKKVVASALDREALERTHTVFQAFSSVYEALQKKGRLTFSNTLSQIGALFRAAEGFDAVQQALEIVWAQLEQPLFLLAHALDPHLRLDGINNLELTKLSMLSDLGVTYFTGFFGRKASSLRGEVTAFLHMSQPVFARAFVSEFPNVEDYFRYLSDDYPALSMLMRLLHSFSSVGNHGGVATANASLVERPAFYTDDEWTKLEYLRQAWNITTTASDVPSAPAAADSSSEDTNGSTSTTSSVVDQWKGRLEAQWEARQLDFKHLDNALESSTTVAEPALPNLDVATAETSEKSKLPCLPADSKDLFPSVPLAGVSAKKVTLKELFTTAVVTI